MPLGNNQLGENEEYCKHTLFENALRTVLLISVPWAPASFGRSTEALFELIDVFPTLQNLAGFEVSPFLEGVSHAKDIVGVGSASAPGNSSRYALAQFPRCVPPGMNASTDWNRNNCNKNTTAEFTAMGMSMRTSDGWRYTRWVKWNATGLMPDWEHDFGEELYDLREESADGDFDAQSDNAASDPANAHQLASLRAELRAAFQHAAN